MTSDEAPGMEGSGNTAPDWEVVSNRLVRARAERSGLDTGRIYTITIRATGATGNSSSRQAYVEVPHNH